MAVVVVVVKWFERLPHNLEVLSSNPPDARAFFLISYRRQSVLNQVPQQRCNTTDFPVKICLANLLEAKQAHG